jgi:hypothetical protein
VNFGRKFTKVVVLFCKKLLGLRRCTASGAVEMELGGNYGKEEAV